MNIQMDLILKRDNDHIKTKIVKYDIILIMTNKDSQKFIKPILENFENK